MPVSAQSRPDSLLHDSANLAGSTAASVQQTGIRPDTGRSDSVTHTAISVTETVGIPVPYNPRTDDVVTLALLLSALAMTWMAVTSWGFILRTASSFFFDLMPRKAIPSDGADIEEAGNNTLLHIQMSFLGAMAYVCYLLNRQPDAFLNRTPYLLLLTGIALFLGWYLIRSMLYRFIDSVFFEHWQHTLWKQVRIQCTFLMTFIFLPLILVEIYFSPPPITFTISVIFAIVVSRFALLMKCYSTFFTYRGGVLHLFLYFCTLEIAPIVVLWQLLEVLSQ